MRARRRLPRWPSPHCYTPQPRHSVFRNADDHVERTGGAPLVTEFGATDDLAPAAEAESGRDAPVLSLKAARGVDEVGVRVAPRR